MKTNTFTLISKFYDKTIAIGRFDYKATINFILPFLKEKPIIVADLASGTGLMANAILQKWNKAIIHCEEASLDMISLLKKRLPKATVFHRKLQKNNIPIHTDLVTIAFNSLNYVPTKDLSSVFLKISRKMSPNGILYLDTLLKSSVRRRLGGKRKLSHSRIVGNLEVVSVLSVNCLTHKFIINKKIIEKHKQYIFDDLELDFALASNKLKVILSENEANTIRTRLIISPRHNH